MRVVVLHRPPGDKHTRWGLDVPDKLPGTKAENSHGAREEDDHDEADDIFTLFTDHAEDEVELGPPHTSTNQPPDAIVRAELQALLQRTHTSSPSLHAWGGDMLAGTFDQLCHAATSPFAPAAVEQHAKDAARACKHNGEGWQAVKDSTEDVRQQGLLKTIHAAKAAHQHQHITTALPPPLHTFPERERLQRLATDGATVVTHASFQPNNAQHLALRSKRHRIVPAMKWQTRSLWGTATKLIRYTMSTLSPTQRPLSCPFSSPLPKRTPRAKVATRCFPAQAAPSACLISVLVEYFHAARPKRRRPTFADTAWGTTTGEMVAYTWKPSQRSMAWKQTECRCTQCALEVWFSYSPQACRSTCCSLQDVGSQLAASSTTTEPT